MIIKIAEIVRIMRMVSKKKMNPSGLCSAKLIGRHIPSSFNSQTSPTRQPTTSDLFFAVVINYFNITKQS